MAIEARIEGVRDGVIRGWAWDAAAPGRRIQVLLKADGARVAACRADRARGDLRRAGIGDGSHGWQFVLPLGLQDAASHLFTLHLAETEEEPELASGSLEVPRRAHLLDGRVERFDGRCVVGWVWDRARPDLAVPVELLADGRPVASGVAQRFRQDLLRGGIGAGAHGFVFDLEALAVPPPPGSVLTVRAGGPGSEHEVGSLTLPGARPAPESAPEPPPAAELSPARAALEAAREAERARDFAAAARHAERGLKRAPRDFDLLFIRSRVALSSNDLELAERFARAALQARPEQVRPKVILARIASLRGQHAAAAELWAAVPPGDTYYRERLMKRGRSLATLGRAVEALAEFAAAVALDGTDREALRSAAEATEAAGGLRAALRRWRAYAAVVPEDARAAERIAELARRAAPPDGLASPLRNPVLRDWPAGTAGATGAGGAEPSPGVMLRSLAEREGRLAFAVAEGWQRRPGELHAYGLWLRAESGGFEAAFALDPAAAGNLAQGLRMGVEIRAGEGPAEEGRCLGLLLLGASAPREVARFRFGARRRLLRFDLKLDATEAEALASGRLALALRVEEPGTVLLTPPRPLCLLRPAPPPPGRFEDAALASHAFARPAGAPADGDPLRDSARPFEAVLIDAGAREAPLVLPAVEARLADLEEPVICAVLERPELDAGLRAALRDRASVDPRLRLLAPDAADGAGAALRRLPLLPG
jgi:tetratricopeptide (TPR) repeat protein